MGQPVNGRVAGAGCAAANGWCVPATDIEAVKRKPDAEMPEAVVGAPGGDAMLPHNRAAGARARAELHSIDPGNRILCNKARGWAGM